MTKVKDAPKVILTLGPKGRIKDVEFLNGAAIITSGGRMLNWTAVLIKAARSEQIRIVRKRRIKNQKDRKAEEAKEAKKDIAKVNPVASKIGGNK